jgi:hypothetical protein
MAAVTRGRADEASWPRRHRPQRHSSGGRRVTLAGVVGLLVVVSAASSLFAPFPWYLIAWAVTGLAYSAAWLLGR